MRDLASTESQALREGAFSRIDGIQVEKESVRTQIDELETLSELNLIGVAMTDVIFM